MKNILLFIFILSSTINVKATHLMGGEITWECIKTGPDAGKYIFNVKVYRDCQGVPIDTNMSLDVHNIPGISTIPLIYLGANDISPSCNTINGPNTPFSCGGINTQTGNGNGAVEEHLYQSAPIEISGTPDLNGWHFTWSSCCRNLAITNLTNASLNNTGFTLRAVMYSYTDSLGNVFPNGGSCYDSSPKFYEKPRTILEVGNGYDPFAFSNGFTYSHNAFDEEQDSLLYSWGMPLNDIGYDFLNPNSTALPFNTPYSYTNPINGIVMNNQTGRTYYPANQQGNYVTCTNVSAYKCGQLVAEIFREVQVVLIAPICNLGDTTNGNVGADTLCNVRPVVQPPFFYPGTPSPFQWDTVVHCGDTVAFDFIANDDDYYPNGSRQDLKFEVSGGQFYNYNAGVPCQNPPCATFKETSTGATPPFITSGGTGEGYFEWITSCNHVINSCSGGLKPSIYTFVIKVQDDFCPAPAIENTSQVISITVYPPCGNIKANAVLTQASCGLSNGTASITPSGGFAPYTSYWFDMNGLPVNNNALAAGDYQLRITDVSLCEMIDTITIISPQIFSTTITGSSPSCFGSNDGSATVSSTSGGSVSYLWSNGANTQMINNLSSGQYSIIVTDGNNCSVYDTIILSQPLVLNSSISITSEISCYGNSDGSLSVQINNGVSPINYLWSNGSSTQTINNLSVGQYNVTVTDSNNCSLTDNITLNQPSELINDSSTTLVSNVSCFGGNTGGIDTSPNGGTPPYYFNWSNGDSTANISNLSSGNYSLIITDSAGCSSISYSYTITTPTQIQNFSVITPVSCNGGNNGSIDISVSGGIPPYSFIWSNGTTTEDITGVSAGVYIVEVTDNSGCVFIDSMNITQPPVLSSSLTSITGGLSGTAIGGTSPYTYEFYGPSGLIATSINNMGTSVVINPNISGLYTLIVTDLNNCIDSGSINFNVNFSPLVIVSLSNTDCDSLSDLTIQVSQDSGEVDMSTAIFQSTAGSFDIASMSVGDTIGTATLMAQGGLIMINTYLMVSVVVNTNQAIVCANDTVLGCIGSFTINNNPGSGIYILTNTIPDGNNYTSGNMSSVTFINCFINPCTPFSFEAIINSELGDVYNETFWFGITSITDLPNSNLKIYPNPSSGELNVQFANNRSKVRLFLTDFLGRDIYINKTYYDIIEAGISLSHLAKGSYILIIESDSERFSEIIMYK